MSFREPGKGRRSLSLKKAITLDDKELPPDSIILEKTTVGKINYITDREKYLKIKERVKHEVISELPLDSEEIKIREENIKKAWIASRIEFTFDIGYTKAKAVIGKKKIKIKIKPLTEEQVRRITNAEKVEKIQDGWKCIRTDDKNEYELILNKVGIVKNEIKRLKRIVALELVKGLGNILNVKEGVDNYLITLDNGIEVKECNVKDINNIQCKVIGIGSKASLEVAEKDFTSFMYSRPISYRITYNNGWKVVMLGSTGKCEYEISLDGKFNVNREINENYCKVWLARKFAVYVVKRYESELIGMGSDGNFDYTFIWDLSGNLKQSIKKINKDYAVKLVKLRLGIDGTVRTLEVNDGVKVDILSGNVHYLAKVDNEGRVIASLNVVEISGFIRQNNVVDWGYNSISKLPIVKLDEGNKYAYYVIVDNDIRKAGEEGKGTFSKLASKFKKTIDPKLRIDTKEVMDLI